MLVFAIHIVRTITRESVQFVGKIVQLAFKMMGLSVNNQLHMAGVLDGFLKMNANKKKTLNVRKMVSFGIQFAGKVSMLPVAVYVLLTVLMV